MDNRQEKEIFSYTYSAKEQDEIQRIRRKYEAPTEDKMAQLRRLDASVTRKATMCAITVGVIGALVFGTGMSFAMSELYEAFGMSQTMGLIVGSIIGIIGLVPVCLAFPVYNRTLAKERERVAPEIIRLSDELMK